MSVDRLAELLRERQPCVVLTGADISTQMHGDFRTSRLDDPSEGPDLAAYLSESGKLTVRRLETLPMSGSPGLLAFTGDRQDPGPCAV